MTGVNEYGQTIAGMNVLYLDKLFKPRIAFLFELEIMFSDQLMGAVGDVWVELADEGEKNIANGIDNILFFSSLNQSHGESGAHHLDFDDIPKNLMYDTLFSFWRSDDGIAGKQRLDPVLEDMRNR